MEALFKILLIIHITAGTLSLIAFWIPVFVKKGGDLHAKVGKAYVFLMWIVVITAVIMSVLNIFIGSIMMAAFLGFLAIITAHPLWYGMVILKHKKVVPAHVIRTNLILNWALFVGGAGLLLWAIVLRLENQAILLMIFGLIGISASAPLVFGEKKSVNWLAEHIQGLLGTGIAAYTAFFAFGGSRLFGHIFTDQLIVIPWILPTVIGVIGIKYWKRKFNLKKKKEKMVIA